MEQERTTVTFNDNFAYDLAFGRIREQRPSEILLNKKIEVKTERGKWLDTGNLAIEIEYRGKPSGLAAHNETSLSCADGQAPTPLLGALVGGRGADRLADVPERSGPDLAIVVDLVDQVSRVLLVPIDPPQARRRGAAEG